MVGPSSARMNSLIAELTTTSASALDSGRASESCGRLVGRSFEVADSVSASLVPA
ncbi:MAG: hypothetical protein R2710_29760 [Acidimicrobiales bacterium]